MATKWDPTLKELPNNRAIDCEYQAVTRTIRHPASFHWYDLDRFLINTPQISDVSQNAVFVIFPSRISYFAHVPKLPENPRGDCAQHDVTTFLLPAHDKFSVHICPQMLLMRPELISSNAQEKASALPRCGLPEFLAIDIFGTTSKHHDCKSRGGYNNRPFHEIA